MEKKSKNCNEIVESELSLAFQEIDVGVMVDSILKIAPVAASAKNLLIIRNKGSGIIKIKQKQQQAFSLSEVILRMYSE